MKRIAALFLLALTAAACDRADRSWLDMLRGEAVASQTVPFLTPPPPDTVPTIARRVLSGPGADPGSDPSPDGRFLTRTDWETGDMIILEIATGDVRRITANAAPYDPGYGLFPRFSRDGAWIAYGWSNMGPEWELRISSVEGGEPRVVYTHGDYLQVEDWSPDGGTLLTLLWREGGTIQIALFSVADGSLRVMKSLDWRAPTRMSFSPDGRWILYDAPPDGERDARDIFALSVDGRRETRVVEHPANDQVLGWVPGGEHVLFTSDRTGTPGAWLQRVVDGRPQGAPELVKPDFWRARALGFTASGSYFYAVATGAIEVFTAPFDPATGRLAGPPTAIDPTFGSSLRPAWSPDGRYIAYVRRHGEGVARSSSIAVRSLETGAVRELNLSLGVNVLRWMPDGRSLVFNGRARGVAGVFRMDIQTGRTDRLMHGGMEFFDLGADGRTVAYIRSDSDHWRQSHLLLRDLETQEERHLYTMAANVRNRPVISPDGRRVALNLWGADPGDHRQVVLIPLDGSPPTTAPTGVGPNLWSLAWTADGAGLLFSIAGGGTGVASNIYHVSLPDGVPERILTIQRAQDIHAHPDGSRIAFASGEPASEIWVMENFLPGGRTDRPDPAPLPER